jgi:hypothetical protein
MILRYLIIFSIVIQSISFAEPLNWVQCNMLKIEKMQCCKTPESCCCNKPSGCKCAIKKPKTGQSLDKENIISKNSSNDEINEYFQKSIISVLYKLISTQNFKFNFNLKTYQAYINLPLLA